MLDELMNLIKEATGNAVNNAADVPNEHTDAIAQEASHSIVSELQGALSGGGLSSVLGMLTGKDNNVAGNSVTQSILGNLTNKLTEKFGLSPETASSLGASIVPSVLSKLTGKINDPNDSSVDLQSTVNTLTDGKTSGLNINSLLDKNGDGHVDLSDAISALTGGSNAAGGGILNKLKGLFGA